MGTFSADETTMDLKSYVRVDNQSGEDFEEAQTRLILGEINVIEPIAALAQRTFPFNQPTSELEWGFKERYYWRIEEEDNEKVPILGDAPILGRPFKADKKEVLKKSLCEYILYTIEGTEDLTNGWGKRLQSLEAQDIPVTSLYQYDESRWGHQAQRFVSFTNDSEHELGQTPLPQGQIKLYAQVDDGLGFIGDSKFKYIPVNEDVELHLGSARYVQVEPVLIAARDHKPSL